MTRPSRGDIFWFDFGPARGSGQAGRRPALVVQNDAGNANAPTTIVVAITSRELRRHYPFHVPLPDGLTSRPSTVLCEQLLTIDQRFLLGGPLAHLDQSLMAEVDEALRLSLGLGTSRVS